MPPDLFTGTGNWNDGTLWSDLNPPGSFSPIEDAEITAAATVSVTDTETAGSVLTDSGALVDIDDGGSLLLGGGTSASDGTFALGSGTLNLDGLLGSNTMAPATLVLDGGTFLADGGTLSSVDVLGELNLDGQTLFTTGMFSVADPSSGPGIIDLVGYGDDTASAAMLEIGSANTLTNTEINFGGSGDSDTEAGSSLIVDSALTLADSTINLDQNGGDDIATISGAGSLTLDAQSSITVGSLNPSATTSLTIATASFENNGVVSGGYSQSLTITGPITGSGTIQLSSGIGSTLDIQSTVAAGQMIAIGAPVVGTTISFDAVNASDPNAVAATITGLTNAGIIGATIVDLTSLTETSSMVGSVLDGVLTITDGMTVDAVFNTPDLADGSVVTISSDPNGGTDFSVSAPECFTAGTMIATPGGEVPVEALAVGDLILTGTGSVKPVCWLGRTTVSARLSPIRICAGALAQNVPHRDLYVSPDHAMYLDGALVPAKLLLNDKTIVQTQRTGPVDYYHVEVAPHDVIIAEGALTESYLDTGDRRSFSQPGTLALLSHGDPKTWEDACAPLLLDGPQLVLIKHALVARAGILDDSAGLKNVA